MRAISFMYFKQHCKWAETHYDFNGKCGCRHPSNNVMETLADRGDHGGKYYYSPCKEKCCPVMQSCKEIKK